MTSADYSGRRFSSLQRQNKSFDGMSLNCDLNSMSNFHPLDISTSVMNFSPHYTAASHSNPTSTNAYFWKQPDSGTQCIYNPYEYKDVQATNAYQSLKHDYEATLEKLNSTMNSIRTFWSPELKRERQMRKEESLKLMTLQKQIDANEVFSCRLAKLEADLENSRCELADKNEALKRLVERKNIDVHCENNLERHCNQLQSLLEIRDEQIRCMEHQLSEMFLSSSGEVKNQQIADLKEKIAELRAHQAVVRRDFTDKTVSPHEVNTLRMKLERSEAELAQKSAELSSAQTRLQAATEAMEDLRKRTEILRESLSAKEKHVSLLLSDIETLRMKLEARNTQLEQKEKTCERLEAELNGEKNRNSSLLDNNRSLEQMMNQLVARLDALEELLRVKENDLEKIKLKLSAHPDIQKEELLQQKIDETIKENVKLMSLMEELRKNSEIEKLQQFETFQAQNQQFFATIESLKKELTDREVLLESQSEKIGELDRDLVAVEQHYKECSPEKSKDEDLAEARKEIASLLKMVRVLENEKQALISQYKQLQSVVEQKSDFTASTVEGSLKSRVQELEEALRESVSITAERELHLAQQKQLCQQMANELSECRYELKEVLRNVNKLSNSDRDGMLQSLEVEKQKQLQQFYMKHETILAAIAKKDAQIGSLEKSRDCPRGKLEALRLQKQKLVEKLKEESDAFQNSATPISSSAMVNAAIYPNMLQPVIDQNLTAVDDDTEGIWA